MKFGGHTYALIKEPATWHVAKQRCEEMGGHLVIVETPKERELLVSMCQSAEIKTAWIGASDEEVEGAWRWINGADAHFLSPHIGNTNGTEHFMLLDLNLGDYNDAGAIRAAYLCEWDR